MNDEVRVSSVKRIVDRNKQGRFSKKPNPLSLWGLLGVIFSLMAGVNPFLPLHAI